MTEIASEGGHWYTLDGTPAYQVVDGKGNLRPTTLRDARKLDLVPSVSGIIRMGAAHQLEKWKKDQHLIAADEIGPRLPEEGLQAWMNRVDAKAIENMAKAPDLGTEIHAAIEKALVDTVWIPRPEAHAAIETLEGWCGLDGIRPEKSFAHLLGYGGKVDVHKEGFVADFKTKAFTELDLPKTWDNHAMQLAAYKEGVGQLTARCAIIYVSTSVPGLTHLVEIDEDEIERGWTMFVHLLEYWQAKNKYIPKCCYKEHLT